MKGKLQQKLIDSILSEHDSVNDVDRKNVTKYIESKLNKILTSVFTILCKDQRHPNFEDREDIYRASLKNHKTEWGQCSIGGKQIRPSSIINKVLFVNRFTGNNALGIESAVEIHPLTLAALREYMEEFETSLTNRDWVTDKVVINSSASFKTPIDVLGLRQFVTQVLKDETKPEKKRLRQAGLANKILCSLNSNNELEQELIDKETARTYFKGLNLQTMDRDIRHAALGKCYQYDLRAGVFGVLAAVAKTYVDTFYTKQDDSPLDYHFHSIKEYISNRHYTRLRVARTLYPDDEKLFDYGGKVKKSRNYHKVKDAITALSFGASTNSLARWKNKNTGKWEQSSLLKILGSSQVVEKFLEIDEVKLLLGEFENVKSCILEYLDEDESFRAQIFTNTPQTDDPDELMPYDQLSDNQKIAIVYQTFESLILLEFNARLKQQYPTIRLLLPVHDGFYYSNAFNWIDIVWTLNIPYISKKAKDVYVQFEKSQYGLSNITAQTEEHHRRFIMEEEVAAEEYRSPRQQIEVKMPKKMILTPFGLMDRDIYSDAYGSNGRDGDNQNEDRY